MYYRHRPTSRHLRNILISIFYFWKKFPSTIFSRDGSGKGCSAPLTITSYAQRISLLRRLRRHTVLAVRHAAETLEDTPTHEPNCCEMTHAVQHSDSTHGLQHRVLASRYTVETLEDTPTYEAKRCDTTHELQHRVLASRDTVEALAPRRSVTTHELKRTCTRKHTCTRTLTVRPRRRRNVKLKPLCTRPWLSGNDARR